MVVADSVVEEAAAALGRAERDRQPIAPPSATYPGLDAAQAYRVQLARVAERVAGGERVRGHKVGLTSRAMQESLGVDQPDFGHLLDSMFVPEASRVPVTRYCAPRIEPEVAFVLGETLTGPGCTAADVLRATAFVVPALELIDSRIRDWRITLVDTIADNASSAGVVLGGTRMSPDNLDLRLIGVVLRRNGEIVQTGATGAVMGDPVTAVCWLANTVGELPAGEVVLPGSATQAVPVAAGDVVRADFDHLGSVSVGFG